MKDHPKIENDSMNITYEFIAFCVKLSKIITRLKYSEHSHSL
jgi:hypothetical protein